jgi:phage repressor protein C with HTH and peptisase S24 domain
VKGEVQAGVWKEAWQWEPDDWQPYQGGSHIDAQADRRFGLVVVGESMNEVYPPGTILDCVHIIGGMEQVRDEQHVIVIRKKFADGCEATVKQFRRMDGKAWLVPRSTHPAFQTPIEMGNEGPDIEETVVIAVVRGSYKPE